MSNLSIPVVLITSDYDWQALYIHGRLKLEDHRVKTDDALSIVSQLNAPFEFKRYHDTSDYLDEYSSYPDDVRTLISYFGEQVQ